jgi:hypothetical protein
MLVKSLLTTYHSSNIGIPGMGRYKKPRKGLFCWPHTLDFKYTMQTLLVGFGDSWTFGSELDRPQEQSWVAQLATMQGWDHINMGTPASSIGHLTVQLFDFIKLNKDHQQIVFMIGLSGLTRYLSYNNAGKEFVNITPEAVYSTSNIHQSGRPPECIDHMKQLAQLTYRQVEDPIYNEFVAAQTIFTFQQACRVSNIKNLFFSYFDKPEFNNYSHIVNTVSIYPTSITQALTGKEYSIPAIRDNKYFAGKLFHPNVHGHTRIAELLQDFYVQTHS